MDAVVVPITAARSRRAAPATPVDPADVAQRVAAGERLYTAAEISAKLHGRSAKSLQRDRNQGMPAVPVGNQYRYVLADVLAWHQRRHEAAAHPDQSCA
jgi:hypothetical protein